MMRLPGGERVTQSSSGHYATSRLASTGRTGSAVLIALSPCRYRPLENGGAGTVAGGECVDFSGPVRRIHCLTVLLPRIEGQEVIATERRWVSHYSPMLGGNENDGTRTEVFRLMHPGRPGRILRADHARRVSGNVPIRPVDDTGSGYWYGLLVRLGEWIRACRRWRLSGLMCINLVFICCLLTPELVSDTLLRATASRFRRLQGALGFMPDVHDGFS
jgi:hypothetical protein